MKTFKEWLEPKDKIKQAIEKGHLLAYPGAVFTGSEAIKAAVARIGEQISDEEIGMLKQDGVFVKVPGGWKIRSSKLGGPITKQWYMDPRLKDMK